MKQANGIFFDGRTSVRHDVALTTEQRRLRVRGEGIDRNYALEEVAVAPRIGKLKCTLIFPDGARCDIDPDAALMSDLPQGKKGLTIRLHRWETSPLRIVLALLMIVLVVWSALKFGVPFLARKAAFSMPPATEAALGRESLQVLDKLFLSPSRLQTARKVALVKRFRQMTGELPDGGRYRLEFRGGGKIGANAFALPSGIIVVTDRLVQIAKSEDEIVGVLAHEMGHVRYRHAVRHLLQNSGVLFLVAAVTGDVMSASSLSATLPTVLIDAKYSREFEEEADDAAVAYLKSHRIPVSSFARMLARLEAEHTQVKGKTGDKDRGGIADFFSTHPVTSERIDRIMRSR